MSSNGRGRLRANAIIEKLEDVYNEQFKIRSEKLTTPINYNDRIDIYESGFINGMRCMLHNIPGILKDYGYLENDEVKRIIERRNKENNSQD